MPVDNSKHIIEAARRRSQVTHRRAVTALRRMSNKGQPINFETVAREAGVSRSWLYNQPEIRTQIDKLRRPARSAKNQPVPDRQRASDASLKSRLEVASQRIKQLQSDNQSLREALSQALSDQRQETTP